MVAPLPSPRTSESIHSGTCTPAVLMCAMMHAERMFWQVRYCGEWMLPHFQSGQRPRLPSKVNHMPYWSCFISVSPELSAHLARYAIVLRPPSVVMRPFADDRPFAEERPLADEMPFALMRPFADARPLAEEIPFALTRPLAAARPLNDSTASSWLPSTESICSVQPTMPTMAPSESPTVMPKRIVLLPRFSIVTGIRAVSGPTFSM